MYTMHVKISLDVCYDMYGSTVVFQRDYIFMIVILICINASGTCVKYV